MAAADSENRASWARRAPTGGGRGGAASWPLRSAGPAGAARPVRCRVPAGTIWSVRPAGAQGLGPQGARDGGQKKFPWKIVLAIAAVLVVVLGTTVIADVARNANDLTTRTPMTQAPAPCPGRGRT